MQKGLTIQDILELETVVDLLKTKLSTTKSKLGSERKPSPALKKNAGIKIDVRRRINRRVNKGKQ